MSVVKKLLLSSETFYFEPPCRCVCVCVCIHTHAYAHDLSLLLLYSVQILNIYILEGNVATCVRCGGIFIDGFMANFVENATVKEFLK